MKGKTAASVVVVLLVSSLMVPGFAAAGEVKGDLALGYYSEFVRRGQTLSADWVIQPEMNFSYNGFGAGMWANYDSEKEAFNEIDLVLNYVRSHNRIDYGVGYINYRIDGAEDMEEFYLTLAHDSLLKPYAAFYWDSRTGSGGFLEVGAGYSHPFSGGISVDLAADVSMNFENRNLGFNEAGEEFTGLYNCDLSIGTRIPVAELWFIEAVAAYSFALSDEAEWAIEQLSVDGESDVAWWGIALKMAF